MGNTIKILKPIVINDLKKLKKVESDPILLILDDFMISHQEKYLLGTEVGKFLDKRAKLISARLERSILNKFENDKIREKRKIINEEKKIAHIERKKERDLKRKEYLMLLQNMSDEEKRILAENKRLEKEQKKAMIRAEKEMEKLGYDGIEIKGREMVNFKPEDVRYYRTENELMNYYENNF